MSAAGRDNARAFRTEQARALWLGQLRDTVRVFPDCGGSYTQAAARLHLHKNTVHYRVRKAEELRGRPSPATGSTSRSRPA